MPAVSIYICLYTVGFIFIKAHCYPLMSDVNTMINSISVFLLLADELNLKKKDDALGRVSAFVFLKVIGLHISQ